MFDGAPSNPPAGTMVRVAQWLLSEVGEGEVFTKEALRLAFPTVGQVDRRMRDLRDYDWVIHTNLEDGSLSPSELRFVKVGAPVWDRGVSRRSAISSADRRAALLAAAYMCSQCGVSAGNPYPDKDLEVGVLAVHRSEIGVYVTCGRCGPLSETGKATSPDEVALTLVSSLSDEETAELRSWLTGSRPVSKLDTTWSVLSRLSHPYREEIFARAARNQRA